MNTRVQRGYVWKLAVFVDRSTIRGLKTALLCASSVLKALRRRARTSPHETAPEVVEQKQAEFMGNIAAVTIRARFDAGRFVTQVWFPTIKNR